MAAGIEVGQDVYVCRSRLPNLPDQGKAFYKTKVLERRDRSVSVDTPGGIASEFLATKFVHRRVGIAVISFGDFLSEAVLIDPLAKTVLQYCRLLFGDDDYVKSVKIRSGAELEELCRQNSFSPYEHIAFIGHGSERGELCGALENLSVDKLVEIMEINNPDPWDFTFLCCYLGRNAFGRRFSSSSCCKSVVAPFNSVHGAVSAQFIQTYLIKLLLEGETTRVALRNASKSTPPKSAFRLWRNGRYENASRREE